MNMINDDKITRKMLSVIRESAYISKNDGFPINKNIPQFADVKNTQEQNIIQTLGENVDFDENSLMYYPNDKDLVLTGKIDSLNLAFQFRYNDPSGDGCYIWSNGLQLTDTNSRTIGKIRDSFINWKNSLIQDGDLIERLKQISEN